MTQYLCELIDGMVVEERFVCDGETVDDVREGLEMFEWPNAGAGAEWRITPVESLVFDMDAGDDWP